MTRHLTLPTQLTLLRLLLVPVIGYTRAARLIDQLAEHGVVGPFEGSKSRDVLMDVFQVDELLSDLGDE